MQTEKRNCGLDLLRTFLMLMVIGQHACMYSGIFNDGSALFSNYAFAVVLKAFCSAGVNCFWLMSGYLLADRMEFRARRFFGLWGWVVFYSLASTAVGAVLMPLPWRAMLEAATPVLSFRYWFMDVYLALLLLAPAINCGLASLERRRFAWLLAVLFLLLSFLPVCGVRTFDPGSFGLAWGVTMYAAGVFLRRHPSILPETQNGAALLAAGAFALLLSVVAANFVCGRVWNVDLFDYSSYNFPATVLHSVALFVLFLRIRVRADWSLVRAAALASPHVIGVYLLHEAPVFRNSVWSWTLGGSASASVLYPLRMLAVVMAVFSVGVLVDAILHRAVEIFRSKGASHAH